MKDITLASTAAIAAAMLVAGCGGQPYTPEERSDGSSYQSYPQDSAGYYPAYYRAPTPAAYYEPTWYYDAATGYYYAPARRYEGPAHYYYAPPRTVYYEAAPAHVRSNSVGVVDRIELVRRGDGSDVVGTVVGGIVGGLIGHQIGSGSGNTAATIAGAAGGAVVGHELQRRARSDETFRVTVRLDNGAFHTVVVDGIVDLRTGDRVRLDGERLYRIS